MKSLQRESDPWQLRNAFFLLKKKEAGRFKMKTVSNLLFLSKVIQPPGRVILMPFKKCHFQLLLYMIFFRGHFWFFKSHFPCRSLLVSKNICLYACDRVVPHTTRPDKHGRVFLVPCIKWLVQWTSLHTCTKEKSLFFQGTRNTRPRLTGHPEGQIPWSYQYACDRPSRD